MGAGLRPGAKATETATGLPYAGAPVLDSTALTETAATSCRDCPRARIRASWVCIVAGVDAPWKLQRRRLDEVADSLQRPDPSMSRCRASSGAGSTPVAGEWTAGACVLVGAVRDARARLVLVLPDQHRAAGTVDANDLAQLYACRWQVELVFKELKSHCRFDELPTRKAPVVEALLLASIITLLASRRVLRCGSPTAAPTHTPHSRESLGFAVRLGRITHPRPLIVLPARTARALATHASSPCSCLKPWTPNASRLLLLQRVDRGVAWAP